MTNKIVLRSVEQFMSDYTPIYQPIYPLALTGKSQSYERQVGKLDFRRVQTVGDIRAKHLTPKDSEIQQIAVMEGKKTFKKYFLANQFVRSDLQDAQGVDEVTAQVLDEHQAQMDDLFLLGEGTSDSDVNNNGLFYSADPNHMTEGSVQIDKDADDNYLLDMHANVMVSAQKANQVAGRKIIMFYGSNILPLFNSLYPAAIKPFKVALQEVLGANYSLFEMPEAVTPSGANGWIVWNLDQSKFHYTVLPQLLDRGVNAEKMHVWSNFMLGSCMLEVLALNGVIRQPTTLEA